MRTLLLLVLVSFPVVAATREIGPTANLSTEISTLNPGDELVLQGGMYTLGTSQLRIDRSGTATMPIIIRSKTGERPTSPAPT